MSVPRVLSGMRPTGPLHLGHWLGALQNWVKLQETHDCYFMVADLHALMGEYENPCNLLRYSSEMVIDWVACGIRPENIFIQSRIPEHAELGLILGMMTPLGWLERNPTYKEQLREIEGRDLTTYGFLGYPVLQAADILLYKADKVPVGEDQLAHLELTREIVRRFKHLYGRDVFPEPEAILTAQARILGTDRRKMSKSYGNAVNLSDDTGTVTRRVRSMVTDPERVRVSDPGHPDACNVFSYYGIFAPDQTAPARQWCETAQKGCTDCKSLLAGEVNRWLEPIRSRRQELASRIQSPEGVFALIQAGQRRAEETARRTLGDVKSLLGLA